MLERLAVLSLMGLVLFAGLVQGADAARIHVRCPVHGESIHVDSQRPTDMARAATDVRLQAASQDDDEDQCSAWFLSHHRTAPMVAVVQAVPVYRGVSDAISASPVSSSSLLRLAPKTSPPLFG